MPHSTFSQASTALALGRQDLTIGDVMHVAREGQPVEPLAEHPANGAD
ncbi:MAG: hypothetical protein IT325_10125, partial [Anaerolineae bacterium]|nr:hypothetical protein [Anaerolineae bacterium]